MPELLKTSEGIMADWVKLPIKNPINFFLSKGFVSSLAKLCSPHCFYEQVPLSCSLPAVPLKINHCSVSTVKSLEFYSFRCLTLFAAFPSYQADMLKTHFYVSTLLPFSCHGFLFLPGMPLFLLRSLSARIPTCESYYRLTTQLPRCLAFFLFFK